MWQDESSVPGRLAGPVEICLNHIETRGIIYEVDFRIRNIKPNSYPVLAWEQRKARYETAVCLGTASRFRIALWFEKTVGSKDALSKKVIETDPNVEICSWFFEAKMQSDFERCAER